MILVTRYSRDPLSIYAPDETQMGVAMFNASLEERRRETRASIEKIRKAYESASAAAKASSATFADLEAGYARARRKIRAARRKGAAR